MENHKSALGGGGNSKATLVLDCFFLVDCCLVDLSGPVCPVNGVRDSGTILGVVLFRIARGSSALTQDSEGIERSLQPSRYSDVLENHSADIDLFLCGKGIEQMSSFLEDDSHISCGQLPQKTLRRAYKNTEGASIPIACRGVCRVDTSRGRSVQSSASTMNNQNIEILRDHSKEVFVTSFSSSIAATLGRIHAVEEVK
ncbi:hypothetical protein M9H77_30330 [Catharanthus roseus]|uniref:Uncharacterized protein n=1 Tax=Catharanthus roseus TaxID=4058 RepID=A0ACB9ZWY2_CATRO|nr:hypothetical protein M9H77_30330 [Catharanthus roseus]